jgi:hypothetical protein
LSYAVTRNFVVTASGTIGFGRNAQNNPPDGAEYREFDQNLASLACTYKF